MKIKVTRTLTEEIELKAGMTIHSRNSGPRVIIFTNYKGVPKYGAMDPSTGEIMIGTSYNSIETLVLHNYNDYGIMVDGTLYNLFN